MAFGRRIRPSRLAKKTEKLSLRVNRLGLKRAKKADVLNRLQRRMQLLSMNPKNAKKVRSLQRKIARKTRAIQTIDRKILMLQRKLGYAGGVGYGVRL